MTPEVSFEQQGTRRVQVIQVVCTTLEMAGEGTADDPVRRITQYWTLEGDLLASVDPWLDAEGRLREALR